MHHSRRTALLMIPLFCFSLSSSGCALLIAGAAGGAAAGTAVSAKESRDTHHGPMTYAGTVLANVVYCPAKVVFAGSGMAVSGLSYIVTLGGREPTNTIWNSTVGGDYVVTPRMIEGRDPVRFTGTPTRAVAGSVAKKSA